MPQRSASTPGRTVALAIGVPEFANGRVFERAAIETFRESLKPMAYPWLRVAELGGERGYRFRTADQLIPDGGLPPDEVLLISYDEPSDTERLLARGARPALLTSLEPPIIAWRLYANLPRISRRFPHVMLFEGARGRMADSSVFHSLRFPIPSREPLAGSSWAERRHMVMVNSNKAIAQSLTRWFDRPREVSLKRWLASVRYPPIRSDGYQVRLRAIQELGRKEAGGLDLFGEGWHRRHPAVSQSQHAAAMRVYRGPADDKLALLSRYRFALAIENTRFPGYVSEKLFDCFAAGCVPVYWGAPDIARYVPSRAFVDMTRFEDMPALSRHLAGMPEADWLAHRDAGAAFPRSGEARDFSVDAFALQVLQILDQVGE